MPQGGPSRAGQGHTGRPALGAWTAATCAGFALPRFLKEAKSKGRNEKLRMIWELKGTACCFPRMPWNWNKYFFPGWMWGKMSEFFTYVNRWVSSLTGGKPVQVNVHLSTNCLIYLIFISIFESWMILPSTYWCHSDFIITLRWRVGNICIIFRWNLLKIKVTKH